MIYIEGTDGVGKTVTIEELKKHGIICLDRNKETISKNMLFSIPMEKRADVFENYFRNSNDIVIFLVNNNEDEMMRRVLSRDIVDRYDLETNKYNKLYVDTYNYMKERDLLHKKLYLVDCTDLSLEKQTNEVIRVIQDIDKNKK